MESEEQRIEREKRELELFQKRKRESDDKNKKRLIEQQAKDRDVFRKKQMEERALFYKKQTGDEELFYKKQAEELEIFDESIPVKKRTREEEIPPIEEKPTKMQKNVFKPTYEYQIIPNGVSIPAGLDCKMDMSTGKNTGRIPEPWQFKIVVRVPYDKNKTFDFRVNVRKNTKIEEICQQAFVELKRRYPEIRSGYIKLYSKKLNQFADIVKDSTVESSDLFNVQFELGLELHYISEKDTGRSKRIRKRKISKRKRKSYRKKNKL